MHPILISGALALCLAVAGCASPSPATVAVDPGPAGKAAPGTMPGQLSPVPAFKGGGPGWRIDIASSGQMDHAVTLVRGDDSLAGNARYLGQPADAPSGLIVLSGELAGQPLIVEIAAEPCSGEDGRQRAHRVQVTLEGAQLRGCGDLAQY